MNVTRLDLTLHGRILQKSTLHPGLFRDFFLLFTAEPSIFVLFIYARSRTAEFCTAMIQLYIFYVRASKAHANTVAILSYEWRRYRLLPESVTGRSEQQLRFTKYALRHWSIFFVIVQRNLFVSSQIDCPCQSKPVSLVSEQSTFINARLSLSNITFAIAEARFIFYAVVLAWCRVRESLVNCIFSVLFFHQRATVSKLNRLEYRWILQCSRCCVNTGLYWDN